MLDGAVVKSLKRPISTYIYQNEEETKNQNTRSRKHIQRTITQEAIILAMESTSSASTARQCASKNFPRKLLCDLANAVMDVNRELLQYQHLMDGPEYRVLRGKAYAKECGILTQRLPGVVDGTDTFDFIKKKEVTLNRYKDITYGKIVCNYR